MGRMIRRKRGLCGLCGVAVFLVAGIASAQAVRSNSGFMANDLGPTDDGSTSAVPLGFEVTYFGANYSHVYVNNNGYVAFDQEVTTLFSATKLDQRLLAVFFADVDTRGDGGSGTVHYGTDTVDGQLAFAATWPAVGYYERHTDKLDTFQVVLINRPDTGAGHFDVECNFGTITWESGDRSDGSVDGVGGSPSAIVGYSDGVMPTLLPGSDIPGSFLDSNLVTGLIHGQSQSNVLGRYVFEFRQAPIVDAAAPPLDDAGASVEALDATVPQVPASASPSALGCACDLAAARSNQGYSGVALLAYAAVTLLARRRGSRRRPRCAYHRARGARFHPSARSRLRRDRGCGALEAAPQSRARGGLRH
jgi:hypothetical protein